MIAAERLLFASALEDLSNQRFVLLSDRSASLRIFTVNCYNAGSGLVQYRTHIHILICVLTLLAFLLIDLLMSDRTLVYLTFSIYIYDYKIISSHCFYFLCLQMCSVI